MSLDPGCQVAAVSRIEKKKHDARGKRKNARKSEAEHGSRVVEDVGLVMKQRALKGHGHRVR